MSGRAIHDAPYWCEENAWHLCEDRQLGSGPREVVVVTNLHRQVALWHQRAGLDLEVPVVWDYHVLLFSQGTQGWEAWDLDTTLPWPCGAKKYLEATFHSPTGRFSPRFRVISASLYRERFASDRRHMSDGAGGFAQEPPSWGPIGSGHCLPALLDVRDSTWGPWFDLRGLAGRYGVSGFDPSS